MHLSNCLESWKNESMFYLFIYLLVMKDSINSRKVAYPKEYKTASPFSSKNVSHSFSSGSSVA